MAISIDCQECGEQYKLKDEFAGKKVKCTKCSAVIAVPGAVEQAQAISVNEPSGLHDAFRRDKFLLRQKYVSINQKYYVWDEKGETILFIERPTHFFKSLLAIFGFLIVLIVLVGASAATAIALDRQLPDALKAVIAIGGVFTGILLSIVVLVILLPKRHIHFYTDESRSTRLLDVLQENKFMILSAYYAVLLPDGTPLGRFKKNYLYNLFRKRWYGYDAQLQPFLIAMEDSMILSLLRRFLGPMFGLLRTNFIIRRMNADGTAGTTIGEFNRKFTLLDRYVLDLSADPTRTLDRRLAVALGILLDTGEKR